MCEFRNPGLWNPEYSSRNKKSGIAVTTGIQNPSSTDKESRDQYWNPEVMEVMEWNPGSNRSWMPLQGSGGSRPSDKGGARSLRP